MRKSHPNKEIEHAIRHAESQGWRIELSKGGHCWGRMFCPYNDPECRCGVFCIASIWSTPRNPAGHAKQILRVVDKCTGSDEEEPDS
ncbi:hypothetical protein DZC52_12190 [Wenzhouxiangella sediminis]|uniref:Uncharacterized protein n=1 Tax=Wenzhouxiangella sediminis TaxID=1792836 RepID=A0A3E1K6B5_9GAMM|nr:hypothetical protein DZC52_12190 [Wenzhouxiangella sediminis]